MAKKKGSAKVAAKNKNSESVDITNLMESLLADAAALAQPDEIEQYTPDRETILVAEDEENGEVVLVGVRIHKEVFEQLELIGEYYGIGTSEVIRAALTKQSMTVCSDIVREAVAEKKILKAIAGVNTDN